MTQPSSFHTAAMESWRFQIPPTSKPPAVPTTTMPPQLHYRPASSWNQNTIPHLPVPANLRGTDEVSEPSLQLKTSSPSVPQAIAPRPGQMPETGKSTSGKGHEQANPVHGLMPGDLRIQIMEMKRKIEIVDETLRTYCGSGGFREPDDALRAYLVQTLNDFKGVACRNANNSYYQPESNGVESSKSLMQQLIRELLTLLHRQTVMLGVFIGLPEDEKKSFFRSTGIGTKLKTLIWMREKNINLTDEELKDFTYREFSGPLKPSTVVRMIPGLSRRQTAKVGFSNSSRIKAKISSTTAPTMNPSRVHHDKKRNRSEMDPKATSPRAKRSRNESAGADGSLAAQPQAQSQEGVDALELELYDDIEQYLQSKHSPAVPSNSNAESLELAKTSTYPIRSQQTPTLQASAGLLTSPGLSTGPTTPTPPATGDWFNSLIEDWDLFESGFLPADHES